MERTHACSRILLIVQSPWWRDLVFRRSSGEKDESAQLSRSIGTRSPPSRVAENEIPHLRPSREERGPGWAASGLDGLRPTPRR